MNALSCEELNNLLKSLYEERDSLEKEMEEDSIIRVLEKVLQQEGVSNTKFAILSIQEDDRQRIARDLHDSSLQNLAHLIHKIELCSLYIDQDPIQAKLELAVMSKTIKEVISDIRNTIFDLRPMSFDDLSLKAAFEEMISKINSGKRYEMDIDIDDVSCENELMQVSIYRVVQEAFHNIDKHAEANKILFYCKQKGSRCMIRIEDNGKGFISEDVRKKEDKHFGLSMMRERVNLLRGKFEIVSKIDTGTKIKIEIPLK